MVLIIRILPCRVLYDGPLFSETPIRCIWVVVKIRVPFWVLNIVRVLLFKGTPKGTLILAPPHIGLAAPRVLGVELRVCTGLGFRAEVLT